MKEESMKKNSPEEVMSLPVSSKIEMTKQEELAEKFYYVYRAVALLSFVLVFFPQANPARISGMINKNLSLFTSGISWNALVSEMGRAFDKGWIEKGTMVMLFIASMIMLLGILAVGASACCSLGNLKLKKLGNPIGIAGSALQLIGLFMIHNSYTALGASKKLEKVSPMYPAGNTVYLVFALITLVIAVLLIFVLPKAEKDDRYDMATKYRLFLMFLPFAILCFVFSYLPLYGWRYAFFDYSAGGTLSKDTFVGFKWFTSLFASSATKMDVLRVLRNTLAMSFLGILTSWCPMAFAIFLNEIKNTKFRRFVQTFTTIPNFISWVLVYAVALAIFSTDGFINTMIQSDTNYLMNPNHIWLKMLLWGMWKGIGWSAIIYIAGISGIDQQLYEAATVDGAGRFQKMWHITVPGLLPTYFVMLLMSVASILSNGMDQYFVFKNAQNLQTIQVLDLYVYSLGIENGNIPLSTVIGMVKSIVSVLLLFGANGISKSIRGESIV